MKRKITMSALLFVSVFVVSCIMDDRSDCDPAQGDLTDFTIRLNPNGLPARADGLEGFSNVIASVDAYLFDANETHVCDTTVTIAQLEKFRTENGFYGIDFKVPPGTYNVVCWGNVDSRSAMSGLAVGCDIDDCSISISPTAAGGPIYYAPFKPVIPIEGEGGGGHQHMDMRSRAEGDDYTLYSAEVVAGEENIKDLDLGNVHRKIQVYIQGYENTEWWDGNPPVVENCEAGAKYDFFLRADTTPVGIMQPGTSVSTPEGDMFFAEFYSALIPLSGGMGICLWQQSTNQLLYTIHFEDYMLAKSLSDDSDLEILIIFGANTIDVTIPSWSDNPIEF